MNVEIRNAFLLLLKSCLDLLHQHVPQHNLLSVDGDHRVLQPQAEQHQATARDSLSSKEQLVCISTRNLENIGHLVDPLLNTLGITSSAGEADTASGLIHSTQLGLLLGEGHLGHVEGPHHLPSGAADGDSVRPVANDQVKLGCLCGVIVVNAQGDTPALLRGDVGEGRELMERHSRWERLGSQLDDWNLFSGQIGEGELNTNHSWGIQMRVAGKSVVDRDSASGHLVQQLD